MPTIGAMRKKTSAWVRGYISDSRGNIAIMFGLCGIVVVVAGGGALDWSRAMITKSRLSTALDAAALAVGTATGLTETQAQLKAQEFFNANYSASSYGPAGPVYVKLGTQNISLSVTASVPTTLLQIAGIPSLDLSVNNQVVKGVTKLRVALALDNTGSMCEPGSSPCPSPGSSSKIVALKTATHQLLTQLQAAAVTPGDVQVALIPFSLDVNVGTANVSASWLDWTNWDAPPPSSMPGPGVGPGSSCPYGSSTSPYGYRCLSAPTNGSSTTTSIPSSGAYKGFIIPGRDNGNYNSGRSGHYYNGYYDSVSATGAAPFTHTWHAFSHSTWNGCVMDRNQDYDTTNTLPLDPGTKFPAENNSNCPPSTVRALGYDWTALHTAVDAMQANGLTNQTIGFAWAWQALTQGDPMNAPASDPTIQKVIIILSDGVNTQNRWTTNGSAIDDREELACANAKHPSNNIIVYALYVHTGGGGSSAPLLNCASDPSKYFDLTSAGEIVTAFSQIGTELSKLRLSL
jgi:Flp pilus assembly protein TadG